MPAGLALRLRVNGLVEVTENFKRAPGALRVAVNAELKRVGAQITATAKSLAPHKKGTLRKQIGYRVKNTPGAVIMTAGPARLAYYGLFQETGINTTAKGAKAYTRSASSRAVNAVAYNPKSGRTRRVKVASGVVFVRAGKPRKLAIRATPFMSPAWDRVKDTLVGRLEAISGHAVGVE